MRIIVLCSFNIRAISTGTVSTSVPQFLLPNPPFIGNEPKFPRPLFHYPPPREAPKAMDLTEPGILCLYVHSIHNVRNWSGSTRLFRKLRMYVGACMYFKTTPILQSYNFFEIFEQRPFLNKLANATQNPDHLNLRTFTSIPMSKTSKVYNSNAVDRRGYKTSGYPDRHTT